MRSLRLLAVLAAATLVLAGCGGGDDDNDDEAVASTTTSTASTAATVALGATSLGEVLVDGDGMTLYLFTNDTDGTSNCTEACADKWPPLSPDGEVVAGEGVDAELLSTITRSDGSSQVAYGGAPLYLFADDAAPGDVNGQGVGGVWFVVGADGEAITAAPSSDAAPASPAERQDEPAASPAPTAGGQAAPPPTTAAPTTSTTAPPAPSTTVAASRHAITIQNFTFSPAVLQVQVGSEVEATNQDGAPHTWTADDGTWDSGNLGQGDAYVHRFTTAGTFAYHCDIHPSMKGSVSVSA